jgi:hypothetical protein
MIFLLALLSLICLSSCQNKIELVEVELEITEKIMGAPSYHRLEPEQIEKIKKQKLYLPKGCKNISIDREVYGSAKAIVGEHYFVTDGDLDYGEYTLLPKGLQWIQIDLGKNQKIHAIHLWFIQNYLIYDITVQISKKFDFKRNVKTIFNTDYDNSSGLGFGQDISYVENQFGKIIKLKVPLTSRYVRVYINGNSRRTKNNPFTEITVYGK